MAGRPEVWTSVARWALVILLIGMFYVKGTTPYGHTSTTHCSCQYVTFQVVLSSVQTPSRSSHLIIIRLLMNIYLLFRVGLWGYLILIALWTTHGGSVHPCPFGAGPWSAPVLWGHPTPALGRHMLLWFVCDLFVCTFPTILSWRSVGVYIHC